MREGGLLQQVRSLSLLLQAVATLTHCSKFPSLQCLYLPRSTKDGRVLEREGGVVPYHGTRDLRVSQPVKPAVGLAQCHLPIVSNNGKSMAATAGPLEDSAGPSACLAPPG